MQLVKEKYLNAYLEYFDRDKKQFTFYRIIYGSVLFFIFATGVLLLQEYLWFLVTPIAFFIGYKMPYWSLISSKKKSDLTVSFLFPQFLQSFMALLQSSGNIYQTLKVTTDYINDPLKSELEKLVNNIEEGNHRDDYMAFANFIGTNEAYMIMDMIYQFSEFGVKKEAINELESYVQSLQENKVNELIERKMLSVEKYGYTPKIGRAS